MHALLLSTVCPLCWTISLKAFCGRELQKGLLSFKNNMLITTHHTERREHVGVRNRCPIDSGSLGHSSHVARGVRERGSCAVVRVSASRQSGFHVLGLLQSPYYFCHLSPQWLQLLNIHDVKWSSSRAQGLLGYLLLGCTHWKKFNKSGIIYKHTRYSHCFRNSWTVRLALMFWRYPKFTMKMSRKKKYDDALFKRISTWAFKTKCT